MNILKAAILSVLMLTGSTALADSVGGSVSYTDDNEGNSSTAVSTQYQWSNGLGVSYGYVDYNTDAKDNHANRVSLLFDKSYEGYKVFGNAGVGYLGNTTYFVGDATVYKPINQNVSVFAGVDGDIVDAGLGIAEEITQTSMSAGADVYNDSFGATAMVRETYFSDNNTRTGYLVKAYAVVTDGLNVYVVARHAHNTDPTDAYYSPDQYNRYSAGLQFKHQIGSVVASGYAEIGRQEDGGKTETANAIKLQLASNPSKPWQWKILGISDIASSTGYRYNSIMVEVNRRF